MLRLLQLAQLADTSFPIGATAHSLGLEALTEEGMLSVSQLSAFLADYLAETGTQEGYFCRLAYRLYPEPSEIRFKDQWLDGNRELSAYKLARESRKASAMLGKRFLQMVCVLEADPRLHAAYALALDASVDIHHAAAFGLVGAYLSIDEDSTVSVYLQQSIQSLIAATQKLLPLGQTQAVEILWCLKPDLMSAAHNSRSDAALYCFPGLVEIASMRHTVLSTRLFIS